MGKVGKKFKKASELFDSAKEFPIEEALSVVKKVAFAKFDETVDLTINLGVDPRQPDQNIRGATVLPHGSGKTLRIIVFAKGDKAVEAKEAGVEDVGADDLATKILDGWMAFDQVVATPDMMGVVGKLGKVLGPRGLMPNPKLGTVTFDLKKAIQDLKAGKAEYRVDKAGIVHTIIGKVSFDANKLLENAQAVIESIIRSKPSSSKGTYIKKISLSSTMGPGVKVDPSVFRS